MTRPNRFIWLGTNKLYDAFTFLFEKTEHGWFQAHIYKFDDKTIDLHRRDAPSTCGRRMAWTAPTRTSRSPSASSCSPATCAAHKLMTNARHLRGSAWLNFQRVKCEQWSHFNGRAHVVLMGDAVHTAHFAIGSGTKLALEDAIELTRQFKQHGDTAEHIPEVLARYQALRAVDVLRLQNAAWNAMEWFEVVRRALLRPARTRAVHVLDADAQPAHQPREPAPARQGLARRLRALVRRARRACRLHAARSPPMFTPYTRALASR